MNYHCYENVMANTNLHFCRTFWSCGLVKTWVRVRCCYLQSSPSSDIGDHRKCFYPPCEVRGEMEAEVGLRRHTLCLLSPKSQLADFHFVVIIPSSRKPAISFIDYYSSYPTNCISGSMIENWHKTRIPSFIMITNMDWQFDLFSINFNLIRCEFLHIYSHCTRINEAKILLFA